MRTGRVLSKDDIDRAMGIKDVLPGGDGGGVFDDTLRRAATLCPIIERTDGLSVILTRRAENLRAHPGQISFPGGKIDPNDPSPLDAALREANEEIGLKAEQVSVSGALHPYATGTGFLVTPFIGFVEPTFEAIADPTEVAEVFEVPLNFVMDRENYRQESYTRDGNRRQFYVIMVREYRIWGATAGMLRELAERVAKL